MRLLHRLVIIHPFANGNGRLSRLYADLLLTRHFKERALSWGATELGNDGRRRQTYLKALRAADQHDYGQLMAFVAA